ncbi:hypothetical protein BKI52_04635 [marine bacterium AO1-C]|nr:hypothetical protein BKI52_04635 [marine bacterium AO1-C]
MTQEKQMAFTQAYAHCQKRFERYCLALAYGKMDAQDLIQDVLLSTYEKFEQIKHKDQLLHYMIRTARNRSISQWRRAKFQTELREKHTRALFAQGMNPELAVDVQLLYRTLETLPDKQRDAIILFDICGFSLKEVADIQQGQLNTVKSHLRRGRKKLQQLMDDKPRKRWFAGIFFTPQISKIGFGSFKQFFVQLNPITMYSLSAIVLAGGLSMLVSLNYAQSNQGIPAETIGKRLWQVQTLPLKTISVKVKHQKLVLHSPKQSTLTQSPKKNVLNPILLTKRPLNVTPLSEEVSPILRNTQRLWQVSMNPLPDSNKLVKASLLTLPKPSPIKLIVPTTCDSLSFTGSVPAFKKKLLKKLKRNGLIHSKRAKNRITFRGNKILVNKKLVPESLQLTYLQLLVTHNITPCPERFIQTAHKYTAIGRMQGGKFMGVLRLNGKVDIDSFTD